MGDGRLPQFHLLQRLPLAFVLGTNEIASADAVHLRRAGWLVVLSHDPHPPVIRRGMAFHDCLFSDRVVVEGVEGQGVETSRQIVDVLTEPDRVAVIPLHLTELLAVASPEVLVDARMQKHRITRDLRHIARITVDLGPSFAVGANCDIAVETRPATNGVVLESGSTAAADGIASRLGTYGSERFVYSDRAGRWHAPVDIGARVFKGVVVGHLESVRVQAPLDGVVRGIVRDGTQVPAGVKLLEIDPRGGRARWTGIDHRGRGIAEATIRAIRIRMAQDEVVPARVTT